MAIKCMSIISFVSESMDVLAGMIRSDWSFLVLVAIDQIYISSAIG